MSRSSQNWSVFDMGMDPIPGDPDVIRVYAARYSDVADAIGRASDRLRSIADSQGEDSEFISAFRSEATKVAGKIAKAKTRYAGVASSIAEYAIPLEDAQTRSEAALRHAIASTDAQQSNRILMDKYQHEIDYNLALTPDETTHYKHLLHHAQQAYSDAVAGMSQARASLQAAIESRDSAATRAANQIENVENTGGLNDSGWQQWWDANGGWIDTAVTVLEWVGAAALIVLAFIPGVDLIEFAIIAIIAVVAIANASMQWSAGTKSPGEAILEIALALIPVGGAVAAKSAVLSAVRGAAESGLVPDAANGVATFTKKLIAKDLLEGSEEALEKNLTNVGKAIFTNEAKTMGQLQSLVKEGLSVNGVTVDLGKIVEGQAWKVSHLLGPLPELVTEEVLKKVTEPIFDRLAGKSD